MTTVRETIKRDIAVKIEGVVKVFDRAALATELREYVVTDKIEAELKEIFNAFTRATETLRQGGAPRDVMGMWVSGFFGSGKSHFAKVLGYLLQNDALGDSSGEHCIDVFMQHLSDTPRGKDIRLRLGEIKQTTQIRTIAFEIKSRQSLSNPNSVGEILLGEFYRDIGLAENFVVARIERRLENHNLLDKLQQAYEARYGVAWSSDEGRGDLMTVRRRLADILPEVDPKEYPTPREAKNALADMFRHETLTAEGIADELVAWVDRQKTTGGRVQHLVFVIDEMGTFIGDSNDKIGELNAIAEMIGNKGKGKVWLIVTSQQDLEKVVDRTNFQPALVGRLNARFELKPHLISDEINKVVSERILKKYPAQESELRELYKKNEGRIAQLADVKASRHLGSLSERTFVDAYPFLPHQIRLAQDIFEDLSGFRISGGVRSMIAVIMDTLQDLADEPLGVIAGFDQVFDAVENDLLSQEYLGASGIRAIRESDERVPNTPIKPARLLKVLWLLQRITWVPRVPEVLAKLLVRNLSDDVVALRERVEGALRMLQEAGYVARDEANGEWKFLSERERTIEQAIQEMVRPGGPRSISISAVRRTSQQMCKADLITKKRLSNFTITYGKTKVPFSFGILLDGETVVSGPELEVHFVSPLASGRKQAIEEIRGKNQAGGVKGRQVWLVAQPTGDLEGRFKRYEALVKVTGDKRFTEDATADTQDALSEKRKERDELRNALVRDLERSFVTGTLFYGGQELELEGATDLVEPVSDALATQIPHVYSRFKLADRACDFVKDVKAILNPANTALHKVAPDLELFDTQGNLQSEAALVQAVLEVVSDLEDEDVDAKGALLLDNRGNKGFQGFGRAPFGWPDEIVRVVLAASFRSGAVYVEQQSSSGPSPIYDYKDSADLFLKVNTFKKLTVRVAETSLSLEQIKAASKALISMGVTGTPESGNAIAGAVRTLGGELKSGLADAKVRAQQGLPIDEAIVGAENALTKPMTAKDPTTVVTEFMAQEAVWKALYDGLESLSGFLSNGRDVEFATSRRLVELAEHHPVPDGDGRGEQLRQAIEDMAALIADKAVVSRWSDYRVAYESARDAYRGAYLDAYNTVREEAQQTLAAIEAGEAYAEAPASERDTAVSKVFGEGRPCHYTEITLPTAKTLLDAAAKRSLSSLQQATLALPGFRSQVEAELRGLVAPPPPAAQTWEWRPQNALAGKRFTSEAEVDQALSSIGKELKAQIGKGLVVVVK